MKKTIYYVIGAIIILGVIGYFAVWFNTSSAPASGSAGSGRFKPVNDGEGTPVAKDCIPNDLVFDFGNQKRHIEYLAFHSTQPCPPYIQCNNVRRSITKDWHDTHAVCIYGPSSTNG